jgi:hypothetical protein
VIRRKAHHARAFANSTADLAAGHSRMDRWRRNSCQIKQPAIKLPVRKMRRDTSGAVFNVSTKPANESATGEVATVTRVPMLKGFL